MDKEIFPAGSRQTVQLVLREYCQVYQHKWQYISRYESVCPAGHIRYYRHVYGSIVFCNPSCVCDGDIVHEKASALSYRIAGSDKTLNVKNLSTGLKIFAILKKLLTNGSIESNGTLILDEPEIHLHPEWH